MEHCVIHGDRRRPPSSCLSIRSLCCFPDDGSDAYAFQVFRHSVLRYLYLCQRPVGAAVRLIDFCKQIKPLHPVDDIVEADIVGRHRQMIAAVRPLRNIQKPRKRKLPQEPACKGPGDACPLAYLPGVYDPCILCHFAYDVKRISCTLLDFQLITPRGTQTPFVLLAIYSLSLIALPVSR